MLAFPPVIGFAFIRIGRSNKEVYNGAAQFAINKVTRHIISINVNAFQQSLCYVLVLDFYTNTPTVVVVVVVTKRPGMETPPFREPNTTNWTACLPSYKFRTI